MTPSRLAPASSPVLIDQTPSAAPARVVLDGRHPQVLDHQQGQLLHILSGAVDLFAVGAVEDRIAGARQHLFRVESGGILPPLPAWSTAESERLRVIAVGVPGTEALAVDRADWDRFDLVEKWIRELAKGIAGDHPSWDIREARPDGPIGMAAGERRRGPARTIVWVSVEAGTVRVMGREPAYQTGDPPIPLASGMWIEAGEAGGTLCSRAAPKGNHLWESLDRWHLCAVACLGDRWTGSAEREAQRLVLRSDLNAAQATDLFSRLSAIVVRPVGPAQTATDPADPLLAACQTVAEASHGTIVRPSGRTGAQQGFGEVVEIARASRLRVRLTLLRGDWWLQDVGPLVAWHGEERHPVALLPSGHRTHMIGPEPGARRVVDRAVAAELAPEAVTFYPTLPSRTLAFRDLLTFSLRLARGNVARIVVPVLVMGLMTLVPPLITQALVNSVIPRSELDQLTFCALALAVTAIAAAGVQTMEGLAMLRLEGLIDWKLQAAMIDRLIRLPASLFREYTVGDLVDRSMGIDAVRRIFTGRTLRSLMAGVFCWFSIFLMVLYDPTLALIAIALALIRALLIMGTSALRLYHESRQFNLQGKVGGFVLQLLAGIGKLRVADAKVRALAVWSKQFAAQKRHFVASQRAANALEVVEATFPILATLIIFASASATGSALAQNLGAFLAFFAAFGQAMAAIGSWAAGVSESLVAIPHITRLRPLIACAGEIADDRKAPGELAGAIELSRVTFRYVPGGRPVLDDVSLRFSPGEYVAIVGPSGSGKSSLFRLLLGFEKPESGTVFYDGKALDTLDTSAVRRQLGVVLQHGRLATGSLYENICGGVQLPLSQAWEAARLAGLEADIRAMPMGMHTAVAEGVNTLSGGQRQRVMIARAIARRPRILLLDEATSSLDNQSQAIVSASLGALNVTRIVIAHRLSTVREADRIIVLVDGKVLQAGTFEELSSAAGMFAEFTRRQLL